MSERTITEEEAQEELESKSKKISSENVEQVLIKKDDVERKAEKEGPLNRFVDELKLMVQMIQDYWNREYREVPWMTVAAVIAALLYVINPADLVPDFIPGVGLVDDATVVVACLRLIQSDFEAYKAWRTSKNQPTLQAGKIID